MQLPDEIAQLGAGGWIGWLVAVAFGGVMAFRRIWHADLVSGANSKAAVDTIQRLYDLLDAERRDKAELQRLLTEANTRADAAMREMSEIKSQMAALKVEVKMLREAYGHVNEG